MEQRRPYRRISGSDQRVRTLDGTRKQHTSGWTLGTGVEYVLATHVTLKGEYLFVDLGDVTVATPAQGGWWPTATRFSEQEHILRMGLNYKF